MDALTGEHKGTPATGRMVSLDVFRGITIAGMILVNNPGTWDAIYSPLEHSKWNGWTPTDLVFPFFLFIVGVSITLALARRAEAGGSRRNLYVKIVRRTLIIFALGLVLTAFPYNDPAAFRIPGVLQRIAACYLIASVIFLNTRWRSQVLIAAALLLAYWAALKLIPVPGFGAGDLSMAGNLDAYVDRGVFGRHTWKPLYDPEGLLSTVPAVVTTLAGVLTGHFLRSRREATEKVAAMFVAGVGCVMVGWAWNYWFPINKALWTSSYVVFTAGLALQMLAACYWLVDIKGYDRWAKPFLVFGSNALAVYFLSEFTVLLASLVRFPRPGGEEIDLLGLIYEKAFAPLAAPVNASLMFAVCTVLLWLGVMSLLYRRRIFIRV
ncbi:MAG TPA: heparan-alpha-glucosaminide N-acetyltransferase domain-containing protein [Pyrinomonadaceae bacterium]|jgi:predicted acyltransferase|nr:heparan-alpha-glucosaminide N-acetyltransferase domain-containing protein [Pyrinomonadaceae bacterium]